jgi:gamma-glutamyl-gamma-aminobutyrate hydrolase PuuD
MFPYDQYILEVNKIFVQQGGSIVVPIYYNIQDEHLNELLDNIDGVLFTGGGLELVNPVTGEQS